MNTRPKIKYFLYARKSSESEDRQAASIDAQIEELNRLAERESLQIAAIFSEAKSAKEPGRLEFNRMIEKLYKGEAQGILCWKLDRLARNPIDGSQIDWMIQKSVITHIRTYEKSYYPADNVIMMQVEFGMANQYIRDLSVNVKRGLRAKVASGIFPSLAPAGYMNTPYRDKGDKEIVVDPERFPIIRKMWDLMLSGSYTPPRILEIANKEWGYRTPKHRTEGDKPMSRSAIYKLFNNPFYYGEFEYPLGSGQWHKGKHQPMITREEFESVQRLLGRKRNPRPHTKFFSFTGMIACGECGSSVTAEEKHQLICSSCKHKFSYSGKTSCPSCGIEIAKMKKPKFLHYIYYHCIKNKNHDCTQGSIKLADLENQIESYLEKIQINRKYLDWAIEHLKRTSQVEAGKTASITDSQTKSLSRIDKQLDRLIDMRSSEEITSEEYSAKKKALLEERSRYESLLSSEAGKVDRGLILAEKTLNFAHTARLVFNSGDLQKKREVVTNLVSNLTLKDRFLSIDAPKPFSLIVNVLASVPESKNDFEPKNIRSTKGKGELFSSPNPLLLPR